jgi:hypothetical protein
MCWFFKENEAVETEGREFVAFGRKYSLYLEVVWLKGDFADGT